MGLICDKSPPAKFTDGDCLPRDYGRSPRGTITMYDARGEAVDIAMRADSVARRQGARQATTMF